MLRFLRYAFLDLIAAGLAAVIFEVATGSPEQCSFALIVALGVLVVLTGLAGILATPAAARTQWGRLLVHAFAVSAIGIIAYFVARQVSTALVAPLLESTWLRLGFLAASAVLLFVAMLAVTLHYIAPSAPVVRHDEVDGEKPEFDSRITDEMRYAFATHMIEYHNEKIIQAMRIFIQLVTAIVGGILYLQSQRDIQGDLLINYGVMADVLVVLVAVVVMITIIANLEAWFGYRKAESKLLGRTIKGGTTPAGIWRVPPPTAKTVYTEIAYLASVTIATILLVTLNPLAPLAWLGEGMATACLRPLM